jgi:hypothetical protein
VVVGGKLVNKIIIEGKLVILAKMGGKLIVGFSPPGGRWKQVQHKSKLQRVAISELPKTH